MSSPVVRRQGSAGTNGAPIIDLDALEATPPQRSLVGFSRPDALGGRVSFMRGATVGGRKIFHLVLIKPSHYDDDGYLIQWVRNDIPSNTLATIYAIALDCEARRVLGDDVQIRIEVADETKFRRKYRRDRRPTLPIESPLVFYPRYAWEIARKTVRLIGLGLTYRRICKRVEADPAAAAHRDVALTPVTEAEMDQLAIFTATESGHQAVEKLRQQQALRPVRAA